MSEDKRILQGKLMNTHRNILNQISDIRANSSEQSLNEDKKKIQDLEKQLKLVAESLYRLYNE
jgi:hypothetical protein